MGVILYHVRIIGLYSTPLSRVMSAKETDNENGENATYRVDKSSEESDKSIAAGEFPPGSMIDAAAVCSFYKNKPDCCKCSKLSVALMWIKTRVKIIFICTVIAISFTVPIIIYGVDADRRYEEDNATMLIDLDLDNCIEATDVKVGRPY